MSTVITGTATTDIATYEYESTQNVFKIVNDGLVDIEFDVGVYYNQTLHPLQEWENRVDYTEFDVFTKESTSAFTITVTNDTEDLVDVGAQLDNIAYSVKTAGAIGDKVQDDTDAINTALSSGICSTVYIPDGDYLVSSSILVPSNKRLLMAKGATIWRNFALGSTTNSTIRNSDFTNGNENISLEGGTFESMTGMTGKHIGFNNVTNMKINNVDIKSVVDDWNTSFKNVDGLIINGMYIDSGRELGTDGLHICSGENIEISDCIILCGDDSIALSIENDIEGSIKNVNINNCYCYSQVSSPIRLLVDNTTTKTIENVNITNINGKGYTNVLIKIEGPYNTKLIKNVELSNIEIDGSESTDKGVYLYNAQDITLNNVRIILPYNNAFETLYCRNITFSNCMAGANRNTSVYGIICRVGGNITVDNCYIDAPSGHGIYFSEVSSVGVDGGKITNNTVLDSAWCGIALNLAEGIIVSNNTVNGSGQYGLQENTSGADYNIVTSNDLRNNTAGGKNILGVNTIDANNLV